MNVTVWRMAFVTNPATGEAAPWNALTGNTTIHVNSLARVSFHMFSSKENKLPTQPPPLYPIGEEVQCQLMETFHLRYLSVLVMFFTEVAKQHE